MPLCLVPTLLKDPSISEQPEAPGVLKPKARKRSPKPLKKSMASGDDNDDIHIYGENLRLLSTSMMFDP